MGFTKEHALHKLRPNTEWVWRGENIDGLTFITEGVTKPTQTQIDKAIADLETEAETAKIKLLADKASALAKLAALGLTEDEAKAVIGA